MAATGPPLSFALLVSAMVTLRGVRFFRLVQVVLPARFVLCARLGQLSGRLGWVFWCERFVVEVLRVDSEKSQGFAAVVILSTVPDLNLGKRIAHILLEENLAACVQIGQSGLSMYQWNGEVQGEQELTLTIKTSQAVVTAAIERLVELHPYEVPQALVLPVIAGYGPYLEWIHANTSRS